MRGGSAVILIGDNVGSGSGWQSGLWQWQLAVAVDSGHAVIDVRQ
jgi:hypothetical protein